LRLTASSRQTASCGPPTFIVISTGFKVTEMAARPQHQRRDGKNLKVAWANDNPTAYLGLTVPTFPEFYSSCLGPNTARRMAAA